MDRTKLTHIKEDIYFTQATDSSGNLIQKCPRRHTQNNIDEDSGHPVA